MNADEARKYFLSGGVQNAEVVESTPTQLASLGFVLWKREPRGRLPDCVSS